MKTVSGPDASASVLSGSAKIVGRLALMGMLACMTLQAEEVEKQDIADLVLQLPTNSYAGPRDQELVEKIAALGNTALPALEKELRPGIRFKELNVLLGAGQSRRGAVVEVLDRMSSVRSTDLLVASLDDPPDSYGMRVVALNALSQRELSADQTVRMLKNHDPDVVLAGISQAKCHQEARPVRQEVERLFDQSQARAQFHNEFGAETASDDSLWEVRRAVGQALGVDMAAEMRTRASGLLAAIEKEARDPTDPDKPERMSIGSKAENAICSAMQKLADLGEPVKGLVEDAVKTASGDHAKVLNMALVYLGDRTKIAGVADDLVASRSPTIRFCAARTLRIAKDRAALAALRKALKDPYRRADGSCLGKENKTIHPIRVIVADALIDLGENAATVRQEMRKD